MNAAVVDFRLCAVLFSVIHHVLFPTTPFNDGQLRMDISTCHNVSSSFWLSSGDVDRTVAVPLRIRSARAAGQHELTDLLRVIFYEGLGRHLQR